MLSLSAVILGFGVIQGIALWPSIMHKLPTEYW